VVVRLAQTIPGLGRAALRGQLRTPERRDSVPARFKKEINMFSSMAALLLVAGSLGAQASAGQRPQAPPRPALTRVTTADCADPVRRDAVLANPEAAIAPWGEYGKALTGHGTIMMDWRSDRLIASGRWTQADKQRFSAELLEDEQFVGEATRGMGMVEEILPPAMLAGDAAKPAPERCAAVITLQGVFERILASVERQWAIADARFAAEARRLGVSLD
jgi:hypothetical protein